jgi:hypothetical protein
LSTKKCDCFGRGIRIVLLFSETSLSFEMLVSLGR